MSSIIIYTKTLCGYCHRAKELLDMKGLRYQEIDLLKEDRYEEMVGRSGKTTVPQIFIDGRHIGGYDELLSLDIKGKLDELIKQGRR